MVKKLSLKDQQLITATTKHVEANTNAHIVTVVLPASDTYSHYIMMLGFIIGSLVDLFLWQGKIITQFPTLLSIQIIFAIVCLYIPGIKIVTLKLLPKKMYHHRAAQVAAEKRLAASKGVDSTKPVLLIFISQAEKYIHIFPNAVIRDKVPDNDWDPIVRELIHSIRTMELSKACIKAIEASGALLSNRFIRENNT